MSLTAASRRVSRPVGTQPIASIRDSQPILVWGPRLQVTPPKTVNIRRTEMAPVPKIARPVKRSLRVSGCIGCGLEKEAGVCRGWVGLAIDSEHGVDNNAGDRDIEPDGIGPACKAAMRGKAARERKEKSNEDHGQTDDGEKNVRRQ